MDGVWISVGIFAGLGVLFGVILAIASKIFAVKVDERVPAVQECLPGANCGGCGFSGCAALADAIVKGEAAPNSCNACSAEGLAKIGEIMGIEVTASAPMHAYVMCSGNCNTVKFKYRYEGAADCIAAEKMGGGDKACPNGCIGLGTCVAACQFDAISVVDGVAVVDPAKCAGCGACANVCPTIRLRVPLWRRMQYYMRRKSMGGSTLPFLHNNLQLLKYRHSYKVRCGCHCRLLRSLQLRVHD